MSDNMEKAEGLESSCLLLQQNNLIISKVSEDSKTSLDQVCIKQDLQVHNRDSFNAKHKK